MLGVKTQEDTYAVQIAGETWTLPKDWNDLTIWNFAQYKKVEVQYKDYQEKINDDSEADEILKSYEILAEMIEAITQIPKDVLMQLSVQDILKLATNIPMLKQPISKEKCTEFSFRDLTLAQIDEETEKISKDFSGLGKMKKRQEAKKKLSRKAKCMFYIKDDLGMDSLAQWIKTEQAKKTVGQLQEKLKNEHFEVLPQIIAHIARRKGEEFDPEIAFRRVELFKELPTETALKVGNFFLSVQMRYIKHMQMFLS